MLTQHQSLTRIRTATELRRLPQADRDNILSGAAALAQRDYSEDAELTAFEAFGKEDLRGESANTTSDQG